MAISDDFPWWRNVQSKKTCSSSFVNCLVFCCFYLTRTQMHMADSVADQHGYVNNAGRFRSELQYPSTCTQKKCGPSTCLDTPNFDCEPSLKPYESLDQELFELGKDEDSSFISNDSNEFFSVGVQPPLEISGSVPITTATSTTTNTAAIACLTTATTTTVQVLPDGNSPGKSVSAQSDPYEDFYLFDFLPYTAGSVKSNSSKLLNNPVHLENPERETRWYFKYFLGKCESKTYVFIHFLLQW